MIGLLGGTFDPIHFGHLRMAQELAEGLSLDEIRFIPAATPPHRAAPHASALHRAEMARLAIAGNPLFALDTREFDRAGPSYMVDTLAGLRADVGQNAPLYLLLGADAFLGLPAWHRWRELFALANIAVAHRPGFVLDADMTPELRAEWQLRYTDQPGRQSCGQVFVQEITALDISASAIRSNILQQQSIRYLLPEAVNDYIQTHHLYQKESHGT